jgi:hypothetical protein
MLNKDINYIVSGLERSGTSLMMQMLHKGGLSVAFDNLRPADEHNPRGYYELAGGKIISRLINGDFDIQLYKGHIIKVTAYGLKFLPKSNYSILYMIRDIGEILKSMKKMGANVTEGGKDRVLLDKLNIFSLELMRSRDDMKHIKIKYRDLIGNPKREMERVSHFLGVTFNIDAAIKAVDESLYRNRSPIQEGLVLD